MKFCSPECQSVARALAQSRKEKSAPTVYKRMSGQPLVCAVLQNAEGKQAKVYVQGNHPMLMPGAQLYDAQVTMRKQGNVAFYTLDGYKIVQQAA